MTVSELQVVVGADTSKAEGALSSLGAKVGHAGGAIATAFGGAALAGIAGLTAGLGASVAAATSFESQMSAVKAVSGATASEMAQLQGLALQLGKDTSFSAKEAAKGIEELVKAGVSIGDVMGGAASASLSLAAAGAVSVGDAAEIAANAMNQFGLQGKDLAGVADLIAGAANASAIDVGDFKFSLAAVGAVANTVGFTFKDTATAIALLGQAGIKGSDAGTSLKTMFLNLQPTTKEQIALFRQLGLLTRDGANAFFDASGKVKSMAEVAGTLQNALKGMTQQQKLATLETIFGSDAIRAAAVFASEGAEGFNEMAAAMGKVTADEVAKERLNNLKGSVEQLTGSLETAAISVGLKLTPMLKGLVDAATAMVNDATPGLEAFAERLTAAFDAVRLTAIDLLDIFRGGDSFDAAFERLATILPEDVALGVVDGVRQIGDAWRTVKQVFAGEWAASDSIDPFVNAVGSIAVVIRDQVIPAVTTFATFVMEQLGTVVAWVSENMPLILATFQTVWGAIVTVVQAVWPVVQAVIGTALQVILGLVKTLMQVLTGDWQGAMDTLASVATTVWESVKSAFSAALPFIGSLIDAATGGWLSTITTWVSDTYTAITTWLTDTQAAIQGGMDAVSTTITNVWNAIKASVSEILPAIRTAILAIWNLLPEDIRKDLVLIATHIATQGGVWLTNITTAGQNMLTAITTKLNEMVTAVTTWATQTFVQPIMDMVGPVGEQAAAVGGGMLTAISTKLGEIIAAVTTWADTTFLAPLRGLVATARTAAENIGNAIVEGIRGSINGAVESVASAAANVVRRALQAAKNAVGIPGDAGVNVDVGDLEGRAAGGPVTAGRAYIVGEQRPELFVPSSSGTILPRVPEIGGGGTQGGGVTVVFQGPVYGWPDFESAVIDAVGGGWRRGVSLGVR